MIAPLDYEKLSEMDPETAFQAMKHWREQVIAEASERFGEEGCIAVRRPRGGFELLTASAETDRPPWRVTYFDAAGWSNGHDYFSHWEDAACSMLDGAEDYVASIPMPPVEEGTREELLERVATGREGKHTATTLLIIHRCGWDEIFEARKRQLQQSQSGGCKL